jgi:translocation and assembly module TamA
MREWGRRGLAACAAAALAFPCASALAQTPGSAELDPTAPLEPLPDLGVEWPDMDAPDAPPPTEEIDAAAPETVKAPPAGIDLDSAEARRYSVGIVGLEGVDGGP